ncbi:MAG: hypothetical protein JXA20_14015 [Spirochaetes bacterium]|nr:hypothetical protein [Spirochaetota bacterium]
MPNNRNNRPSQAAGAGLDPAVHHQGPQRRAVEAPEYLTYVSSDPWPTASEIMDIFGVRFFFRVHLRTYSFKYLSEMIDHGIIAKRSQLLLLRGMLGKVKENAAPCVLGERHLGDIDALEERIRRILE